MRGPKLRIEGYSLTSERVERRLAAVLAADVAGYSRLMGSDEERTLADLKAVRRTLVDPKIAEHRGRIVKTTGDGMLLEFFSTVDAVRCAVDVQLAMRERNIEVPPDRRIEFRIGINAGDIIIDAGDIFGDGVNIAARLETFAQPGEICVSGRVREDVEKRLDVVFEDFGSQIFKNIADSIHVFGVDLKARSSALTPTKQSHPSRDIQPDRLKNRKASLAVLPFNIFGNDDQSEFLADGLVEDILTALARFKLVSIIARNSTFAYRGQGIDVRRAGIELGATYILEGSVRRSGDTVRITAQLIDATSGGHLWAERYDRNLASVFEVQSEVAQAIVAGIEQPLVSAENRRGTADHAGSSTDVVKAAGWQSFRFDRASNDTAIAMLLNAVSENPGAYRRQQALAMGYCWRMAFGWADDPLDCASRALAASEAALRLNDEDAWNYCVLGWSAVYCRQFETGRAALHRAVQINPNSGVTYGVNAWVLGHLGDTEQALESFGVTHRLAPQHPFIFMHMTGAAWAHFACERWNEAAEYAETAALRRPNCFSPLVVTAAIGGLRDDPSSGRRATDAIGKLVPNFSIRWLTGFLPLRQSETFDRACEGLRAAGVVEG
jgi:TolB-like protein/class 3 adenylate cyclase